MVSRRRKGVEILVVDDNAGDVHLLRELLSEAKNPNHVHTVRSGKAALMFMRKEGSYSDVPSPDLVLLDIKMPNMSGIEVLEEIRGDSRLCRTPVIVLSSSDDDDDVARCYDLHANCYLIKPMDLEGLEQIVSSIDKFWLAAVRFPSTEGRRADRR